MANIIADAGDGLASLLNPLLNPQHDPGGPTTTSSPAASIDPQPDQPGTTSSPSPVISTGSTTAMPSNPVINTRPTSETTGMSQTSSTPSSSSTLRSEASLNFEPTPSLSSMPNGISTPSSNSIPRSSSIPSSGPTPSDTSMPSSSFSPNGSPSDTQTKVVVGAVVGAVTGAAVIIILSLFVLCILRRQRRHKAIRSTSSHEACNGLYQRMPQSTQFSPRPQPFLDSPAVEIPSPSEGTTPRRARNPPVPNKQRDIAQAVDSHRDPVSTGRNLSNNGDEGRDFRETLYLPQSLTSQFEREAQELSVVTQPGQVSTEDRRRLEEIRRTTSLISLSSSPPPSYFTHVS